MSPDAPLSAIERISPERQTAATEQLGTSTQPVVLDDSPEPQSAPAAKKRKLTNADRHMLKIADGMASRENEKVMRGTSNDVDDTRARARRQPKKRPPTALFEDVRS